MRLKRPEGMNIIPFIDIMLVLLTIVLTVSTFLRQTHLSLDLPYANSGERSHKKQKYEIIISKEGTLYWNEILLDFDSLKEKLQAVTKEDEIILKADINSSFGSFITVVDHLKSMHHPHINILVHKE